MIPPCCVRMVAAPSRRMRYPHGDPTFQPARPCRSGSANQSDRRRLSALLTSEANFVRASERAGEEGRWLWHLGPTWCWNGRRTSSATTSRSQSKRLVCRRGSTARSAKINSPHLHGPRNSRRWRVNGADFFGHYLGQQHRSDTQLKIRVLNVSKRSSPEPQALQGHAWDQSPVFKKFTKQSYGQLGGDPTLFDWRLPLTTIAEGMSTRARHQPDCRRLACGLHRRLRVWPDGDGKRSELTTRASLA